MTSRFCSLLSILVAAIAILIGFLVLTPYPKQWGLYKLHATLNPVYVGMTPAHYYDMEWNFKHEDLQNVQGQHALVTGANSGIGFALAKGLTELGAASVTLTCRSPSKCQQAVQDIREQVPHRPNVVLETLTLDTSSLKSVQTAVQTYLAQQKSKGIDSLDMLFLNAGTVFTDSKQKCVPLSEDGIEMAFATNYVGHHLLYRSLEPALRKSPTARVVSTSSAASYNTYSYKVATNLETLNGCSEFFQKGTGNLSYGQTKLAQILWSQELTRRLGSNSRIFVNAFHPGMVDTGLWHKSLILAKAPQWLFDLFDWLRRDVMWLAKDGALTGLYLGTNTEYLKQHNVRGLYFHPQGQLVQHPHTQDMQLQQDLWEFTESLVAPFLPKEEEEPIPVEENESKEEEE